MVRATWYSDSYSDSNSNATATSITDLISAVVRLLERDINSLVVEAQETLELVKLRDKG